MLVYSNEYIKYCMGNHFSNYEDRECLEKDITESGCKNNSNLEGIYVKTNPIIENDQETKLCHHAGFKMELLIIIIYFDNSLYPMHTNITLIILNTSQIFFDIYEKNHPKLSTNQFNN